MDKASADKTFGVADLFAVGRSEKSRHADYAGLGALAVMNGIVIVAALVKHGRLMPLMAAGFTVLVIVLIVAMMFRKSVLLRTEAEGLRLENGTLIAWADIVGAELAKAEKTDYLVVRLTDEDTRRRYCPQRSWTRLQRIVGGPATIALPCAAYEPPPAKVARVIGRLAGAGRR